MVYFNQLWLLPAPQSQLKYLWGNFQMFFLLFASFLIFNDKKEKKWKNVLFATFFFSIKGKRQLYNWLVLVQNWTLTCSQLCSSRWAKTVFCCVPVKNKREKLKRFNCIYRQSSVKTQPIKNISSNNTLHIFHTLFYATHINPGYSKNRAKAHSSLLR